MSHEHSMWECGSMQHVGSWHWMDEPCTLPEGAPARCRFTPYRLTRLDLKPAETYPFNPDWVVEPGATLKEWREEYAHLPATAAAKACARMPVELYEAIEKGEVEITPKIAGALEHGTSIPAYLWLNLERAFRAGLAAGKTWTRP